MVLDIINIIAIIVIPIFAVLIGQWPQNRSEKRKDKVRVFSHLMSYRAIGYVDQQSVTPIIVERIVKDIDDIVKIARFDSWQNTTAGKQEIKKALRNVVWIKYKIKDIEVFDNAYKYIEQYY